MFCQIVKEKKEVDNIKNTDRENVSQPKKVEGKNEEANFQLENSTNIETALTGSEGKPEDKSDSAVVVMNEEDTDKASGSDDLVGHVVEEVGNVKKESETSATSEPAVEGTGEELKNRLDVSNTPVPRSDVVEKPEEDFEASSVQETESEASKKQAVSESVAENVKGEVTEPSTVPSSISEEENKQKELTAKAPASDGIETLGTEEGSKTSQDEKRNFEETVALEILSAVVTDVAKLQEAGKGAAALEATGAPQKTDADLNASRDVEESAKEEMGSSKVKEVVKEVAVDACKPDPSAAIELVEAADESSVIKITEDSMKPEAQVEEQQQEKITEAEEPNLSEKSKIDTASEVAEFAFEGEWVSGSTEKVEEKKNERLEINEQTLVETSKDLKAATGVSEVSSEEGKASEGVDKVEDKDEHLESKEEITRDLDAASIVAEASSQDEKASEGAAVFEEKKDEGLKDEKVSGLETSKDFDAASEVAEFSSQEKVSRILEIVAEKKEESLESDKTTSIETSESSDAAAVSSKDEESSIAVEMVDKKDKSLEGGKPTLVKTSKDFDVVTDISGVSLVEEKTSGGAEMVQEKDEKEKSPEGAETVNEKKNEASEGARKTLGETFKEHDMEEKNVISASATEPVADSEEIEKDKELARDFAAETGKPDEGNLVEPSKDGDVTKQDKEAPKQPVHKTSKHHSSNILSKMKHLIVKAKKAILGKSPSSKTMSAGTKDDIEVK